MASNFAEALFQGRNDAISSRLGQQQAQREQQRFDMGMQKEERALETDKRKALYDLASGYKSFIAKNPQGGQQYYETFLKPSLAGLGLGDAGPYDPAAVESVADQVIAAYGGQQQGAGVQSTYIDNQGNRVAIMRDGSTQILGQNQVNNRILEAEGGFVGVNPNTLRGAPVTMGGSPSNVPPQNIPGTFIDPALPPEVQAQIRQSLSQGQEPPAQMFFPGQPQGGGQQLRPAQKERAQETFSQPQAVTGPDGQIRYVQFGNRGGSREVQGYSAPPTDRDAKPPTEGERKAATLLRRLTGSLSQLQQAVKESPDAASPSLGAEAARRIPFVGEAAANTITPAARQRVEAAQLDILDAALTLGTGAAYTREQLEGYRRSYFPQIGDSDATIQDKAARLNNVIEAAQIAAGRAGPDNPERPDVARETDDIDSLLDMYR